MPRRTDDSDLTERVVRFLDTHHVMSMATNGSSGPHAANLLYARDGLSLVWVSDPDSRHSLELDADSRVAATIASDTADYADIRGVQIAGTACRVSEVVERDRVLAFLALRYSYLAQLENAPSAMKAALSSAGCYRLEPIWIVLIDNSRGFGHKETLVVTR